jgi:hypothetical protein
VIGSEEAKGGVDFKVVDFFTALQYSQPAGHALRANMVLLTWAVEQLAEVSTGLSKA